MCDGTTHLDTHLKKMSTMFMLVLILKWSYASLVGAEAGEVKFSPILKRWVIQSFSPET